MRPRVERGLFHLISGRPAREARLVGRFEPSGRCDGLAVGRHGELDRSQHVAGCDGDPVGSPGRQLEPGGKAPQRSRSNGHSVCGGAGDGGVLGIGRQALRYGRAIGRGITSRRCTEMRVPRPRTRKHRAVHGRAQASYDVECRIRRAKKLQMECNMLDGSGS